ncbi:MAG TPA: RNA methyltransferase [Candidatus Limnocylindrales bacterium]|nr:RNA methyltransferase [Candidatus Limnocylindrales bacterium]
MPGPITSRHNPMVARYRAAAAGTLANAMLVDGLHLVSAALDAGARIREAALAADRDDDALLSLAGRLQELKVSTVRASGPVMKALSPLRSASPVVAIADRPLGAEPAVYRATPLALLAAGVQDPGNVGAIVRVAEAAGATGVVAAGPCADPFGWKALRGSMGSALRLPVLIRGELSVAIEEARVHGCRVVATVPRGGRSLFDADLTGAIAILLGGEGRGLEASLADAADERVTIPMRPPVESLNVATAAALMVYEAARQRRARSTGQREAPLG